MFYETLENYWRYLVASGLVDRNASASFLIAAGITIAYASWYIWTFKLALLWRPSEPKPLPYLVPCKFNLLHIDITLMADYSRW